MLKKLIKTFIIRILQLLLFISAIPILLLTAIAALPVWLFTAIDPDSFVKCMAHLIRALIEYLDNEVDEIWRK